MVKRRKLTEYKDLRDVPIYTVRDAAHYLQLPPSTLRSWVAGRYYPVEGGKKRRRFQPIILLSDKRVNLLSFFNLAEAHVLSAFRRDYGIALHHIRAALRYVARQYGWERPLIQQEFKTDGVTLLVERLGKLIDVSAAGQMVMKRLVEEHLKRLEWEDDVVTRLYPFTRAPQAHSPKSVFMDVRFCFGRPILKTCHIATAVIAERYKAGDSVDTLAFDYGCARPEIEEALRCELVLAA